MDDQLGFDLSGGNKGHGVSTCLPQCDRYPVIKCDVMMEMQILQLPQYYGIRGNFKRLEVVCEHTERAWRYWLSRRSHTGHIRWQKFVASLQKKLALPKPRIMHNI
jgi:hypothetical protein